MAKAVGIKATRDSALAGDAPRLATSQDLLGANPPLTGRQHAIQKSASTSRNPTRINLKAVAEACIDAGLDPAVEILRALTERIPVLDRSGQPVLGPDGAPVYVDRVDPDTRIRTLNELLQYTQPKLKAVEVKLNGALELSTEQLDNRLAMLIAKAAK